MIKKKPNILEIKRRISKCKNRLDKLKNKGFIFSKNIYYDLELLEKKLIKSSLIYQIWDKKISLIMGIVFIISIFVIFNIISPPEESYGSMKLDIVNVFDGLIINESFSINGTANHSNGDILLVQVKLDDRNWENASGTYDWNYFLIIDDLLEGKHTLYFRCWDGINYSNITDIIIQLPVIIKPIVEIHNPHNGSKNLNGVINISGTATVGSGEIQKVEIKFNEGPWENVTGTTSWQRYWDTKEFLNGDYYINVRCNDSLRTSSTYFIFVNIYNLPNSTFDPPPIPEGKSFQIYIPPWYEVLMRPGIIYEVQGIHRKNSTGYFNLYTYTLLEFSDKSNWLNVSIPNQYLETTPNGKIYNLSIDISISTDAPKNGIGVFTILAYSSQIKKFVDSGIIKSMKLPTTLDVYVYTGQW